MSHHTTIEKEFQQLSHGSFPENNESVDFHYAVRESWVRELGFQKAFIFGFISSLSHTKGFCFMKDATIAKRLGVSIGTIERALCALDKKKWIYRNSYAIGKGRGTKRFIITKDKAIDYWKNILSKSKAPQAVKEDYIKHFFEGTIANQTKSNEPSKVRTGPVRPRKNEGSIPPHKNEGSLLLRNKSIKYELRKPPPILNEEIVERELKKYGFEGERIQIGLSYFQSFKKEILNKRKPMGFLISSVEKGYAIDDLERINSQEKDVTEREDREEENKKKAKTVFEELKELKGNFKIKLENNMIAFTLGDSYLPIGWRDSKFDHLLSLGRKKVYDLHRISNHSSSVATG